MQKIEENVSKIPDSISDERERITNKELLSQYKKELNDIKLYISLNGKIRKAITSQLAQITYKMQSEMAAFSVLSNIYMKNTNANRVT